MIEASTFLPSEQEKTIDQPSEREKSAESVELKALGRLHELRSEFSELVEIDPAAEQLYQHGLEAAWQQNARRLTVLPDLLQLGTEQEQTVLSLVEGSIPSVSEKRSELENLNHRRATAAALITQAADIFDDNHGTLLPTTQLKPEKLETALGLPLTDAQKNVLVEIRAWRTTDYETTKENLQILKSSILPSMSVWQELVAAASIPSDIVDCLGEIATWAELQQVVGRMDETMTKHRQLPKKDRLATDDQKLVWAAVMHDAFVSQKDTEIEPTVPATLLLDIAEGRWSKDDPWLAGDGILNTFTELEELLKEKKRGLTSKQKKLVVFFMVTLVGMLASGVMLQNKDSFLEIVNSAQAVEITMNEVRSETAAPRATEEPAASVMDSAFSAGLDELESGGNLSEIGSEIAPANSGEITAESVRTVEWAIVRGPVPGGFWKEAEAIEFNANSGRWRVFRGEIQPITLLPSHETATTVLRRILPIATQSLVLSTPPGYSVTSVAATGLVNGDAMRIYQTESGAIIVGFADGTDTSDVTLSYGIRALTTDEDPDTDQVAYLEANSPQLLDTVSLLGPDLQALPTDAFSLITELSASTYTDQQRADAIFNYVNTYYYSLDTSYNQFYFSGELPVGLAMMDPNRGRHLDCDGFQTVAVSMLRSLGIEAEVEYGYANSALTDAGLLISNRGGTRDLGSFERHGWARFKNRDTGQWQRYDFTGNNIDTVTRELLLTFNFNDGNSDLPIRTGAATLNIDELPPLDEVSQAEWPNRDRLRHPDWPVVTGFGLNGNLAGDAAVDLRIPEVAELPSGSNWTINGDIPIEPFIDNRLYTFNYDQAEFLSVYSFSWRQLTADHVDARAETLVTSTFLIAPGESQLLPVPRGYKIVSISLNVPDARFNTFDIESGTTVIEYDSGEPATISYGLIRSYDEVGSDLSENDRYFYTEGGSNGTFPQAYDIRQAPPEMQAFLQQLELADISDSEKTAEVYQWVQDYFTLTLDPRYNDVYFNQLADPLSDRSRPLARIMEMRIVSPDLANTIGVWMLQHAGVPARLAYGYRTNPLLSISDKTLDQAEYGVIADWFDVDSEGWQSIDFSPTRVDERTYEQLLELNNGDRVTAVVTRSTVSEILHQAELYLTQAGDWWDGNDEEVRDTSILSWFIATLGAGTAYFLLSRYLLTGTQRKIQRRLAKLNKEEWQTTVEDLTHYDGALRQRFMAGLERDESPVKSLGKAVFWFTGLPSGVSAWQQLKMLAKVDRAKINLLEPPSTITEFYEQAAGMNSHEAERTALDQNIQYLGGGFTGYAVNMELPGRSKIDDFQHLHFIMYSSVFTQQRKNVATGMGIQHLNDEAFGQNTAANMNAMFKMCRDSIGVVEFIDKVFSKCWREYQHYYNTHQFEVDMLDEEAFLKAFMITGAFLENYYHQFHAYSQYKK